MENQTPPYIPFGTFLEILDALQESGLPPYISAMAFPAEKTYHSQQMYSAAKFLGLIGDSGQPTNRLKSLVSSDADRPKILKDILRASFIDLFAEDLENISREDFFEALRRIYGVDNDTRKKVRSFFLKAAQYSGIPLSNAIIPRNKDIPNNVPTLKFNGADTNGTDKETVEKNSPEIAQSNGAVKADMVATTENNIPPVVNKLPDFQVAFSHTINFGGGGAITISADVKVLDLNEQDRNIFFKIMEDLKKYEKA